MHARQRLAVCRSVDYVMGAMTGRRGNGMANRRIEKSWTWHLKAPREALWPLLSDTTRINEALRMPAYRLRETIDGDGLRRRHGEYDMNGERIRWEEPPYEWARGYWWRWQRYYESGPLEHARATLVLEPGPKGGTAATYTLESEPRSTLGRVFVRTGHHKEAAKAFERILRLADTHARKPMGDFYSNLAANRVSRRKPAPYAVPPEITGADRVLARQMLDWLAVAFDSDLREIRPKRMARALGLSPAEAESAAVVATEIGALERHFRLICQICHGTVRDVKAPRDLPENVGCPHCGASVDLDFAHSVEVLYTAHEAIRKPTQNVHCASGPAVFPRTVMQQTLEPHERRELPMRLLRGDYVLRTVDDTVVLPFTITNPGGALLRGGDGWLDGPAEADGLLLENHGERPVTFILARAKWPSEATSLAEWLTYQSAREAMGGATINLSTPQNAGEAALVIVSARGGDEAKVCRKIALAHGGAVVEDTGAGTLLIFHRASSAVAAMETVLDDLPSARVGADYGPLMLIEGIDGPNYMGEVRDRVADLAGVAPEGLPSLSPEFQAALRTT